MKAGQCIAGHGSFGSWSLGQQAQARRELFPCDVEALQAAGTAHKELLCTAAGDAWQASAGVPRPATLPAKPCSNRRRCSLVAADAVAQRDDGVVLPGLAVVQAEHVPQQTGAEHCCELCPAHVWLPSMYAMRVRCNDLVGHENRRDQR